MRISDWSADVCSSDLEGGGEEIEHDRPVPQRLLQGKGEGLAALRRVQREVGRLRALLKGRDTLCRNGGQRQAKAKRHRDLPGFHLQSSRRIRVSRNSLSVVPACANRKLAQRHEGTKEKQDARPRPRIPPFPLPFCGVEKPVPARW